MIDLYLQFFDWFYAGGVLGWPSLIVGLLTLFSAVTFCAYHWDTLDSEDAAVIIICGGILGAILLGIGLPFILALAAFIGATVAYFNLIRFWSKKHKKKRSEKAKLKKAIEDEWRKAGLL